MTKNQRISELEMAVASAIPLITYADEGRCFAQCRLPQIATRTIANLESVISPAALAQEFSE